MKGTRTLVLGLLIAVATSLGTSATALGQDPETQCTASFHVLHDDHIGRLQLPNGIYQLRTNELTCTKASSLFSQFLADYNGVLPRPWSYTVQGVGNGRFTRGGGTGSQFFDAVRVGDATAPSNPGSHTQGGGTHGALVCPASFRVLNNDRVGSLRLRRGNYQVTLLGGNLTCGTASSLFRRFLNLPSGRLPGGWVVLAASGEFVSGASHNGFRVKPL
jgi:hypothetical protein